MNTRHDPDPAPPDRSSPQTAPLTPDKGKALVSVARRTLEAAFARKKPEIPETVRSDPALKECRGTFVTLKIDGQLRGCIGDLAGRGPLVEGVQENAKSAAFNDYRFKPLKKEELDQVSIEVSILTEPRPLSYRGPEELVKRLRPHVDGVILRKGSAAATFLPQVWEQLPGTEDFLGHLCLKAGLPADIWRREPLQIDTYQVQYFEEEA